MTVFTRVWDAAYEANPPDTQKAKLGATRIKETRTDTRERLEVDHSWAGDVDDGMHKKVTFVDPLAVKPTQANDETYLYSKDVAGTAELFFEDEAGNEVQLTSGGKLGLAGQAIVGVLTGSLVGNCSGSSGSCTGNSATASAAAAWTSTRTITITGDASGSGGNTTGNPTISITLAPDSVDTNELVAGAVQAEMAISAVGAIGTFAFLYNATGVLKNPGNTVAVTGTELRYSDDVPYSSGTSPSGTWRCCGRSPAGTATVWLRVS